MVDCSFGDLWIECCCTFFKLELLLRTDVWVYIMYQYLKMCKALLSAAVGWERAEHEPEDKTIFKPWEISDNCPSKIAFDPGNLQ